MRTRAARSLLVLTFITGLVAAGEPLPAGADPGCSSGPAAYTADLSIDQSSNLGTDGAGNAVVTYTLNLNNAGPCPMPKPSVFDTLPPSAATATSMAIVRTNPSSWVCDTSGFPASFICSLSADFGTGTSADGYIQFSITWPGALVASGNYTNDAKIVDPTTDSGCVPSSTAICDVNALNNESWGGLLLAGGSLSDGVAGADQFRLITAPNSLTTDLLATQITHSNGNCQGSRKRSNSVCPLGNQIADISIQTGGTTYIAPDQPFTFTFYFSQKAYRKKPTQINITHRESTGDVVLGPCPFAYPWVSGDVVPSDGCVALRTSDTLGGVTYSVIVVYTPHNDDWFGW